MQVVAYASGRDQNGAIKTQCLHRSPNGRAASEAGTIGTPLEMIVSGIVRGLNSATRWPVRGSGAVVRAIAQLCERYPDWRLGQLVANVAGWADQEIWDVEDEQLLEAARLHLERPGVQVDAAVKLVGLVVESHRGLLGLGGA